MFIPSFRYTCHPVNHVSVSPVKSAPAHSQIRFTASKSSVQIQREKASRIVKEKLGIDKPLSGAVRVTSHPRPGEQYIDEKKYEEFLKDCRKVTLEELKAGYKILEEHDPGSY